MYVAVNGDYKGPIDKELLKVWCDWMKQMKARRKRLQTCASKADKRSKEWYRKKLTRVEAEIETLSICINQVHTYQKHQAAVAQLVEQGSCKAQVVGSNPVQWHHS